MSSSVETIDRIAPTRRPNTRVAGYQCWSNLLFVHWRVPAAQIQPLIPPSLSLDLWEGEAWVGLVPFYMSGVRPWWSPSVPWLSSFCETNVRTYVHRNGADPGVWFFSLEAARAIAVWIARWHWRLNYFHARMSLYRTDHTVRYASDRLRSRSPVGSRIEAAIGAPWNDPRATGDHLPGTGVPGTLEHFLVERYYLYVEGTHRELMRGQVHHRPYPLRSARVDSIEENLLEAAGISVAATPCHAIFSEGVSVEVFPLLTMP